MFVSSHEPSTVPGLVPFYCRVRLNRKMQKYAVSADDKRGFVERYVRRNKTFVIGVDGNLVIERVYGKVIIYKNAAFYGK